MTDSPPGDPNEPNGESRLLSFVVRLWKEESASEEHQESWRGHITAVSSGKRQYFSDVSDIPAFIIAHLKAQQ